MKKPTDRQFELYDAFVEHGSQGQAAKALGISRQGITKAVGAVRAYLGEDPPTPSGAGGDSSQRVVKANAPTMSGTDRAMSGVVYVEREPTTLEEALDKFNVDREAWRVRRWTSGEWNGMAKVGVRGKETLKVVTLYKISIEFERIVGAQALKGILEAITEKAERKAPKWRVQIKTPAQAAGLLSLNIPDLHLGKLAWSPETDGPSYDVKIAGEVFREALGTLIAKTKRNRWRPERILLPLGNDFLNSDRMIGGKAGATTAGTLQDEDGRWQRSFAKGFLLASEGISAAVRDLGVPVDVVVVPGNHDLERIFYLGHSLECEFRNHPGVTIDNRPVLRKYYEHDGKIVIGLTHGKDEHPDQLPLLMATRFALGEYVTKEWYLAHIHQRKGRSFETHSETGPVLLRWFPSLSPADSWHAAKGYEMSARSAEAIFYGPDGRFDGSASFFA